MEEFNSALEALTRAVAAGRGGQQDQPRNALARSDEPPQDGGLWGQIKTAWANPNQQALLSFGGGAQNGNETGILGKLVAPIPGMDPTGRRSAQGVPEAIANTAHTLSPNGLWDMGKGIYDAANRLTTPVDDNKGYQEQGDSYVPYNGAKKVIDAFGVASALPLAGAPAALMREGSSAGIFGGKLAKTAEAEHGGTGPPSNPTDSKTVGLFGALNGAQSRAIDPLGYYSQASEAANALRQAKGTPEQMLAQLKSAGVKQAEIDATNLAKFLDGKKSVTRDEIAAHLEQNRVGVKEVVHGSAPPDIEALAMEHYGERYDNLRGSQQAVLLDIQGRPATEWSSHSLDPSNPTYRETVLHLAKDENKIASAEERLAQIDDEIYTKGKPLLVAKHGKKAQALSPTNVRDMLPDLKGTNPAVADLLSRRAQALSDLTDAKHQTNFQSGHFPEPNIIGHMMTSMTKHEGKPVYTIDQIQSDWGQRLRDGGVRDEAKIAELRTQYNEALKKSRAGKAAYDQHMRDRPGNVSSEDWLRQMPEEIYDKPHSDATRLGAELRTAEASAPGHPLVNTTDQWTTTTLRRAIQQAAEADADHIAIPHGKTVLSYNPGDTHGMETFYNSIVPKNLHNILKKLDPATQRQIIGQLETPNGMKGQGFTMFPLSETAKAEARKGLPLFSNPTAAAPLAGVHDYSDFDAQLAALSQLVGKNRNALSR